MFKLRIIRHSEASKEDIANVIKLKSIAWPYPFDSQEEWISKNIKEDDLHVFLQTDDVNEAYMNLVDISLEINGVSTKSYGIGNVCTKTKGMGYGNKLMTLVNDYLKMVNRPGLLFCHEFVEPFYVKCGWKKIEREICFINGLTPEIFIYGYNLPPTLISLKYGERLF